MLANNTLLGKGRMRACNMYTYRYRTHVGILGTAGRYEGGGRSTVSTIFYVQLRATQQVTNCIQPHRLRQRA
jgi:hypothetical protein